MNHTPAQILAYYLTIEGIFTSPTNTAGEWPLFVTSLPGGKSVQQAAALRDTEGVADGRLMVGETIDHPGIQLRIRVRDYLTGWRKIWAAANDFSAINQLSVVMTDGTVYIVHNVSRISSVLPMGVEPETGLPVFSVNFLVTITQA